MDGSRGGAGAIWNGDLLTHRRDRSIRHRERALEMFVYPNTQVVITGRHIRYFETAIRLDLERKGLHRRKERFRLRGLDPCPIILLLLRRWQAGG